MPSSPTPACLRSSREGVELDVLVQPRASRSEWAGMHDGRMKIRLAAPPVDGAANDALVDFLAETAGVPRRDVTLLRGGSSRRKTLLIRGTSAQLIGMFAEAVR